MGIKIALDLNIPGKYLLVIAVLFIISMLLFSPNSPLSVTSEEPTEDNALAAAFSPPWLYVWIIVIGVLVALYIIRRI